MTHGSLPLFVFWTNDSAGGSLLVGVAFGGSGSLARVTHPPCSLRYHRLPCCYNVSISKPPTGWLAVVSYAAPNNSPNEFLSVRCRVTRASDGNPGGKKEIPLPTMTSVFSLSLFDTARGGLDITTQYCAKQIDCINSLFFA